MSRYFTEDHEWVDVEGDTGTVGISDYAAGELGDVVYVQLPEVGAQLTQFEKFGEVESVKAVSDLFSPVSGEVTEVNEALADSPQIVNESPYDEGWMLKVRLSEPSELEKLLTAEAYDALLAAARAGTIPRSTLTASFDRILALKRLI